MAAWRRFLLLLGACMFLSTLSFYLWNMPQERRGTIQSIQDLRKQLIRERCKEFPEMQRLEDITSKELLVNDNHTIIYCYIPKVACTNWKRIMYVLKQGKPYPDLNSISSDLVHQYGVIPLLKSFPKPERKAKLKHYTKFLVVRDTFVRLISAYRDKFQSNNDYFYQLFSRDILRLYGNQPNPPMTVDEANKAGLHVSFYNFIQYLVDPRTAKPFEPHWRPMHQVCHLCQIEYDFIGHQETLQQDAEQLLNFLNLEDDITFPPSYKNMTTSDSVLDWFNTVPLKDRRKLYKIYEEDFRLFGFRKPVELLDD
ncbi:carbohydrate sulfotransferase 12-like [Sebastes fasciatus]|uniref:carbohydrate sulfotransferase 12-like n=1 Tax=Sebastes fasciatus TaxID=394691 RepID=UPI003D9FA5BD